MPGCLSPQTGPVSLLDLVLGWDQGRVRPTRDNILFVWRKHSLLSIHSTGQSLTTIEKCCSSCLLMLGWLSLSQRQMLAVTTPAETSLYVNSLCECMCVSVCISVLLPEVVMRRRCRQEEPEPSVSAAAAWSLQCLSTCDSPTCTQCVQMNNWHLYSIYLILYYIVLILSADIIWDLQFSTL